MRRCIKSFMYSGAAGGGDFLGRAIAAGGGDFLRAINVAKKFLTPAAAASAGEKGHVLGRRCSLQGREEEAPQNFLIIAAAKEGTERKYVVHRERISGEASAAPPPTIGVGGISEGEDRSALAILSREGRGHQRQPSPSFSLLKSLLSHIVSSLSLSLSSIGAGGAQLFPKKDRGKRK